MRQQEGRADYSSDGLRLLHCSKATDKTEGNWWRIISRLAEKVLGWQELRAFHPAREERSNQ